MDVGFSIWALVLLGVVVVLAGGLVVAVADEARRVVHATGRAQIVKSLNKPK